MAIGPSAPPSSTPSGRGHPPGPRVALLLVLCGAIFLEGIDVAMLNVALPSIRADLGLATGELQWVLSAYVLGYGGFMLLGGRAADLFGRRRMFLVPLAVFLVFSGLGGVAVDGWMLIVARFTTGVAAAFMTPAGLSIITTTYPEGPARNKALLIYSGTAAAGFSLGLVIGGVLAAIDWRWVFFAPVALSGLILCVGFQVIPRSTTRGRVDRDVDYLGALTITGAILLTVLTVERATHVSGRWTTATLALSLLLLGAFAAIERCHRQPLVRLGIIRNAALVRANAAAALFASSFFGFQFIAVLYLQELRGWSALETSFALLAIGVDAILAPTLTPRLVQRFGNQQVIAAGLVLATAAYALFLRIGLDSTYAAMFPTMLLLGVAFALAYGPLTIAATDGINEEEQGLAAGFLYTSFQFGAAIGLSSAAAINVAATGSAGLPLDLLGGYRAALLAPLIAAMLAVATVASGLRGSANGRPQPTPSGS